MLRTMQRYIDRALKSGVEVRMWVNGVEVIPVKGEKIPYSVLEGVKRITFDGAEVLNFDTGKFFSSGYRKN